MTVLEATIQTLKNLGGKAHYSKIYEEYENVIGYKITKNQQAGIRKCIETHSSDSDAFNGKDDIFYSVYGKGMVYGDYDDCFVLCFATDEIVTLGLQLNLKIA